MQLGPPRELGVGAEGVEDDQARGGTLGHGDGDSPVGLHDRRRLVADELTVEHGDLTPVGLLGGRRSRVAGGDGRLELIGTGPSAPERPLDEHRTLGDLAVVPAAAVLIGQQHELALVVEAGRTAGVGQQQQGDETDHLGLVGQEVGEDPGEADSLVAELGPDRAGAGRGSMALGENQIDHPKDARQALRQGIRPRDAQRYAGLSDLARRPDQALGHGGLGHQEDGGDLARGEAAHRAQRQRHPHPGVQRGMAAREDETELVVLDRPRR